MERRGYAIANRSDLSHDDVARMGIALTTALALEDALGADPQVLERLKVVNRALARELSTGDAA